MPKSNQGIAVVLVHGLWLNKYALKPFSLYLKQSGFIPYLFDYSSIFSDLQTNAERLATFVKTIPERNINFVGHSLGGLVILTMLKKYMSEKPCRVVLLGSPIGGSELGRAITQRSYGKYVFGQSRFAWDKDIIETWNEKAEVGSIAGISSPSVASIVFSYKLKKPNDGVVTVEETRIPGFKDYITLPAGHTFGLLLSKEVRKQAEAFLKNGQFLKDAS